MREEEKIFIAIISVFIICALYMLYYFKVVKKNREFKLQQKLDEIKSTRKFKYPNNSMATIFVNQSQFDGKDVTIINGRVIINGVDRTPDAKEISIRVEGALEKLEVDYANKIDIVGDVGEIQNASGDLSITGNVNQSVSSVSGSIKVGGDIKGNATAVSGNIKANSIGGHVSTVSGDIKQTK